MKHRLRDMTEHEDLVWQVFYNDNQWMRSLRSIAIKGTSQDKAQRMRTFVSKYYENFLQVDFDWVDLLKVYFHLAESAGWLLDCPGLQWSKYVASKLPTSSDTIPYPAEKEPMSLQDWGDFAKLEQRWLASIEEEHLYGLGFKHMGTATGRFPTHCISKSNTPKEENMKAEITHRTEINGTDINEMSHSDLIHTIQNVENKIETLEKIQAESSYVCNEIRRLQNFVKEVVKLLDAK